MPELPVAPSFRLDGKRALVTGAGRGIGLAAAAALAEHGASVTLAARSLDEIEAAAAAIRARGFAAEAMQLDVTDLAAIGERITRAAPFDILLNNAGCNRPGPYVDATPEDFDAVMGLNVRAAYFVAQSVAKRMIAAERKGSIIHMSSQMGHVGGRNRTLYCASKWALEGLNKAMALDLAPYGIRSNSIAPTFIETEMTAPFFADAAFKTSVLDKIKLGRLGQVEDLTGAIVFLASDASGLMTGSSIVIDGGWTAD
ncbi:SDR family NAD(P)-dependent oxidoreductase [Hydrocarboniphaga sp.]|uniref:SDR family NAD(P)-dependent oxidoreductase n=1 Tax=Hydrocarboniphaga sp. TaxID=2033016 RepID=UPI003D14773F